MNIDIATIIGSLLQAQSPTWVVGILVLMTYLYNFINQRQQNAQQRKDFAANETKTLFGNYKAYGELLITQYQEQKEAAQAMQGKYLELIKQVSNMQGQISALQAQLSNYKQCPHAACPFQAYEQPAELMSDVDDN